MPSCFRADEWQYEASQRLQSLLTRAVLKRLVGDFERSLRADRRAETGQDRPSLLHELADALLIAHDIDLLAQREVREALARAIRTSTGTPPDNPKRWVAGQLAARQFTRAAGLPAELAGVRSAERPSAFISVAPPATYLPLKPYQAEMSDAMYRRMNDATPDNRAIISLPTGAGKTRVAVETLHHWAHDLLDGGAQTQVVIVWLAHTEELCEQAVECFEDVWRAHPDGKVGLGLARFWGGYRHRLAREDLFDTPAHELPVLTLVSTPQSFVSESLDGFPAVNAIVIDEAHRAAAPTYRTIIQRYGGETAIVGLTATPFRREFDRKNPTQGTEALCDLFRHLELPTSLGNDALARLQRLQEMKVLSRPVSRTVETRLTLNVSTATTTDELELDLGLELNLDQELQEAADQTRRRRIVISTLLEVLNETPSARVLYFGPTVQDAELVAFMLRLKGKRAATVSGQTRTPTRRAIIADFKAGRLDVLCNCEVLTTGFDAPTVSHIIMARPTVSQVLYEQMVGRGLRGPEFGGTEHCVIIDFKDRYRGQRPRLGYEAFREIWHPRPEQMYAGSDTPGMLVKWGTGEAVRIHRSHGQAKLQTKEAQRRTHLPLSIRLEGPGEAKLTIEAVAVKSGGVVSHQTVELGPESLAAAVSIDIRPGQKLRLSSVTSEPNAYVDVRRNHHHTAVLKKGEPRQAADV